MISRTVVDLVDGSGISLEDQGKHELKGVPGAWRLFTARLHYIVIARSRRARTAGLGGQQELPSGASIVCPLTDI